MLILPIQRSHVENHGTMDTLISIFLGFDKTVLREICLLSCVSTFFPNLGSLLTNNTLRILVEKGLRQRFKTVSLSHVSAC